MFYSNKINDCNIDLFVAITFLKFFYFIFSFNSILLIFLKTIIC